MHARVSTYTFRTEAIDDNIDRFRAALQATGLEEMTEGVLLVDRATGKAITITFWEDEDALTRTRQAADAARGGAVGPAGGSIDSVEEYEVALKE
jgi:hypothetical protein